MSDLAWLAAGLIFVLWVCIAGVYIGVQLTVLLLQRMSEVDFRSFVRQMHRRRSARGTDQPPKQ